MKNSNDAGLGDVRVHVDVLKLTDPVLAPILEVKLKVDWEERDQEFKE